MTLKLELEVTQDNSNWYIPFESLSAVSYSPSIVTMALSCIISDIKRHWSKIVIFHTPLHSTPPLERSPSEYCNPVWYRTRGQSNLTKSASRYVSKRGAY